MYPIDYFPQEIGDMDRVYGQFVSHNDKLWDVKNYKNFLEDRENKIISFSTNNLKIINYMKSYYLFFDDFCMCDI